MSDYVASSGPEKWVREAISQQEEYLKRRRSCMDQLGRAHRYVTYRPKGAGGTIPAADMWQQCLDCGVTATDDDYQRMIRGKLGTEPESTEKP